MQGEAATRVILADDHDVVRQGLKRLLDRAPHIEVVGEARDGLEALESVKELQPDVLLLDIEMPVMDGIEVARQLQETDIAVHILVLSAYDDREYIRSLLEIGVSGYLVKGEAPGKIIEAIRGVAEGQQGWISPQVRKKLEKIQKLSDKQSGLTQRELLMLELMAAGKPRRTIARRMDMQEEEYRSAEERLFHKLSVKSRKEAVDISIREGWISDTKHDIDDG